MKAWVVFTESPHAGRKVHENERVSLEALARYRLRPALSQERLRVAAARAGRRSAQA